MTTECCIAVCEPRERPPIYPDEPCHRYLDGEEPNCGMATGANYNDEDDKMAADETTRALDHIREMCLDRPCPVCKGEVIDKPQDDVRQCRGCGHVWGFDDTQNLEEFVREFARMEPCVVCGNDSLDKFEVVDNHGRQELICGNCQSVQGKERLGRDWNEDGYEVVQRDQGGYGNPERDLRDPDPRRARDLACPFCPDMTNDFFEKQYDGDELVRAVCPSCSYVVFFKGQDDVIDDRGAEGNDVEWAQENDGRAHGNGGGWAQEDNKRAYGNGVGWAEGDDGRAHGNGVGWAQEDDGRAHGNGVGWAQGDDGRAHGNGVGWAQGDDGRAHGNGVGWPEADVRRAHGNGDGLAEGGDRRANGNGVGWAEADVRRAHGNGVGWAQEDNRGAQENGVRWAQADGVQDIRAPEDGNNGGQRRADRRQERERQREGADDRVHLFRPVRRAMRYLCVKPIDLAQHALKECADSVIEKDENLVPRLKTMASTQGPIVAEQLGWTIGTTVGNIMFRTPEGAAFTGNVGSIVGRGFCNLVLQTMINRRR